MAQLRLLNLPVLRDIPEGRALERMNRADLIAEMESLRTVFDDIRSAWNDAPIHQEELNLRREDGVRGSQVSILNPSDLLKKNYKLQKLTKNNWYIWKNHALSIFSLFNIRDLVMGQRLRPDDDAPNLQAAWDQARDISWHLMSTSLAPLHSSRMLSANGDPVILYKLLKEWYLSKNPISKYGLTQEFNAMIQAKNETFDEYYDRFTEIINDLSILGNPIDMPTQVFRLMESVSPKFGQTITKFNMQLSKGETVHIEEVSEAIRAAEKWSSRIKRCQKLRFLESAKFAAVDSEDEEAVLFVQSDKDQRGFKRKKKGIKSSDKPDLSSRKCYNCGERGHIARNCKQPQRKRSDNGNKNYLSNKYKGKNPATRRLPMGKDSRSYNEKDFSSYVSALDDHVNLVEEEKTNTRQELIQLAIRAVLDSGATRHMSPHRALFKNYRVFSIRRPVRLADKSVVFAHGMGDIVTKQTVGEEILELVWENCFHVPDLSISLFSCTQIARQGYNVLFTDKGAELIYRKDPNIRFVYGITNTTMCSTDVSWEFERREQVQISESDAQLASDSQASA